MSDSTSQTTAWPEELLTREYREFPSSGVTGEIRFFQKRFDGPYGVRYFLNFREWEHRGVLSYDAQLCGDTSTGGYAWVTLREDTIEATEHRAEQIWQAMGCAYYERRIENV